MTAPRLGSLWRLTAEAGGHVVLVATENAGDELHALLAVDRAAGPEDVVVADTSVMWLATAGAPVVRAIACRQQTVIARDWLAEELGMLGPDEREAVGWLSAPPPVRNGVAPPEPGLVGTAYTGLDDPRLSAVRADATVARGLLEAAHRQRAGVLRSAGPAAIGKIGERLLQAVRGLVAGVSDVVGVGLEPDPVLRGDDDVADARPAVLEIPRQGKALLGDRVRSGVVIAPHRIDIWLSGVTRLAPGEVVVIMALAPTGLLFEARATVLDGSSALSFELEWDETSPPDELALVVVRA